jgi:hypothetical protein
MKNLIIERVDANTARLSVLVSSSVVDEVSQILKSVLKISSSSVQEKTLDREKSLEFVDDIYQQNVTEYYALIVGLYDDYTKLGHSRTAAIKRISLKLRSEGHPWASVDLIRSSLVSAGRPCRSFSKHPINQTS